MTTLFRGSNGGWAQPPALVTNRRDIGASLVATRQWPLGNGYSFTNVNSTPTSLSPYGRAWTFNGSSQIVRAKMTRPFLMSTDQALTMLVVFKSTAATVDGNICGLGADTGASGNTLCRIRTSAGSAARLNGYIQDSSGSLFATLDSSSITINDGAWHCAIFSCDIPNNGIANWYIDGSTDGTNTGAAATPAATTFDYVCAGGIRRGGTDITNYACDIALFVPIFRRLSLREGLSLSADPWQLFRPNSLNIKLGPPAAVGGSFQPAWAIAANSVIYPGARAA